MRKLSSGIIILTTLLLLLWSIPQSILAVPVFPADNPLTTPHRRYFSPPVLTGWFPDYHPTIWFSIIGETPSPAYDERVIRGVEFWEQPRFLYGRRDLDWAGYPSHKYVEFNFTANPTIFSYPSIWFHWLPGSDSVFTLPAEYKDKPEYKDAVAPAKWSHNWITGQSTIYLNKDYAYAIDEKVIAHEVGHALGLAHNNNNSETRVINFETGDTQQIYPLMWPFVHNYGDQYSWSMLYGSKFEWSTDDLVGLEFELGPTKEQVEAFFRSTNPPEWVDYTYVPSWYWTTRGPYDWNNYDPDWLDSVHVDTPWSLATIGDLSTALALGDNPITYNYDFHIDVGPPVPEPSTILLLGSGLIGLVGYGRKKLFKK